MAPATSFTLIGGQTDRSLIVSTSIGKGGLSEIVKTRGGPQRCEKQLIEVIFIECKKSRFLVPNFVSGVP